MSGNSSNASCVQDYFKFDSCNDFSINTCGALPCSIKVDPDIGGIGIIYSFIVTVWVSMLIAVLITFGDFLADSDVNHSTLQSQSRHWLRDVLEPIALSVSDAAVITGYALLFAGFFRYSRCQMSVYHYQLVRTMSMLSILTHAGVLQVLAGYNRKWSKSMGFIRGLIIFGFDVMFLRFVDLGHKTPGGQNRYVSLPAKCYYPYSSDPAFVDEKAPWNNSGSNPGVDSCLIGIAFGLALIVILLSALSISPWLRESIDRYHCYFLRVLIQTLGILGFAGYYTYKLLDDWKSPLGERVVPPLADSSQSDWGFGQIVPVVLLASTGLTFVETWRTRAHDDGKMQSSWTVSEGRISDLEHYGYQNALANSAGLDAEDPISMLGRGLRHWLLCW